jgi:hypothetical protein
MAPRLSNGASDNHATHPTKGTEVEYVVKVSILGLAGITVDRPKCRDHSYSKHAPAPPRDMTAVVSILHDSQSQGSTQPSNALKRSPQDGVIIRARCADGQEEVVPVVTSGLEKRRQRHVAVWNYDDKSQDASIVFHTKLLRLDADADQTAVSSAFARKNFELIVGLVDNVADAETKYALPIGAANLAISADHPHSLVAVMDLPVNPLAFSESSSTNYVAIPTDADAGEKNKKKRGLARVFSRKQAVEHKEESVIHVSDAEKEEFCAAYAVDSNGDVLLRVEVEVWEKGTAPSVVSRASTKASKTSRLSRSTRGSKSSKTSSSSSLRYILPLSKRMNSSPSVQIAKARSQVGFEDNESPIHLKKPPEIRRVQSADHVEAKQPNNASPMRPKSPTQAPTIDDLAFSPVDFEAINSVSPSLLMEESIERVWSVDDSERFTAFPLQASDSPKNAIENVAPKKIASSQIESVAKSAVYSSPKSEAKSSTVAVTATSYPQSTTNSSKEAQGKLYSIPAENPNQARVYVPPVEPITSEANKRFNKDDKGKNENEVPKTHEEDPSTGCAPGMTVRNIFDLLQRPLCGTAQETVDSPSLDDGQTFASLDLMGRRFRVPECGMGRGGGDEASWQQDPDQVFREGLCRPESFNSLETDNNTNRIARWKKHLRTMRANDGHLDENSLSAYEEENTVTGSKGESFDGTVGTGNSHEDDTLEDTLEESTVENTLENTLEGTLEGTLKDTLEDTVNKSFEELFSLNSEQFLTMGNGTTTVSNDKTPDRGNPAPKSEPIVTPPKIERTTPLYGLGRDTLKLSRQSEDESPRGVNDLHYASGNESSKPTLSQTLLGFISCRTTISKEDIFDQPPSTSLARDVPDYLIPRPGDDSSIGELTATTHEMRVDIEAYKQSLIASKDAWKKKSNPTSNKATELFKFGAKQTTASEETPCVSESESEKGEDYFKEYNDFSFLSPEMAAAAEVAWAHKKAANV